MVLHTSMLDWTGCGQSVMNLIQCSGLPEIYDQLEEGRVGSVCTGICAYGYLCNLVSVVVCHRSMVDLQEGSVCPRYLCIMLYVKLIQCSVVVFHRSMANWRGSVCLRYMCIMLYVKLIWCSDLPEIYDQLEEGWGLSALM